MRKRIISTVLALAALTLVLRYLPQGPKSAEAKAPTAAVQANPADLRLSGLQASRAMGRDTVYVDGMVTNSGQAAITGATAAVEFRNLQGEVVGTVEKPLAGMGHDGIGTVRNEFAQHPLGVNEMRVFRVAVEQPPAGWNHEVPTLKILAVNAQ